MALIHRWSVDQSTRPSSRGVVTLELGLSFAGRSSTGPVATIPSCIMSLPGATLL
ncbi:hypothetical protein TRIUR3_14921 [Triticum urartu]|uniref:Uncharacterized protein n=1 Tax=Triticum urartu TaxID=4572 RepID=M8AWR1_TRIUA|nr:hypothetical protein TRIUR3_14921 [Triticum urartu]